MDEPKLDSLPPQAVAALDADPVSASGPGSESTQEDSAPQNLMHSLPVTPALATSNPLADSSQPRLVVLWCLDVILEDAGCDGKVWAINGQLFSAPCSLLTPRFVVLRPVSIAPAMYPATSNASTHPAPGGSPVSSKLLSRRFSLVSPSLEHHSRLTMPPQMPFTANVVTKLLIGSLPVSCIEHMVGRSSSPLAHASRLSVDPHLPGLRVDLVKKFPYHPNTQAYHRGPGHHFIYSPSPFIVPLSPI